MRFCVVFALILAFPPPSHSSGVEQSSKPVASVERKLQHLKDNAALQHPHDSPTEFTEEEINAYFEAENVKLPTGVQSVKFEGQPGIVEGVALVDFDQIRENKHSSNPLLSVFSGVHNVAVTADAHGAGGEGFVTVRSVSLDGVEIPRLVLQLFVDKYLKPKYPNLGLESRFALPERIDKAILRKHKLTIIQK